MTHDWRVVPLRQAKTPNPRTSSALHEVLPQVPGAKEPDWLQQRHAVRAKRRDGDPMSEAPATAAKPVDTAASANAANEAAQRFEEMRSRAERAGLEAAKQKVDAVVERYVEAIARLEATEQSLLERFSRYVADLSTSIAKEVLRRELSMDGDGICSRLEDVLASCAPQQQLLVRLSSTELDHITRCRPDLLARGVDFIADDKLGLGGCIVEGADRIVDLSIDRCLEAVRTELHDAEIFMASNASISRRRVNGGGDGS